MLITRDFTGAFVLAFIFVQSRCKNAFFGKTIL